MSTARLMHFVGTAPQGHSVAGLFDLVTEFGGPNLMQLPTEGGSRTRWAMPTLRALANNPALGVLKPSFGPDAGIPWLPKSTYWADVPMYYKKPGRTFYPEMLYAEHAHSEIFPAYEKYIQQRTHGAALQIGIEHPLNLAGFSALLPQYEAFATASVEEVYNIQHDAGPHAERLVYQLDMPFQAVLADWASKLGTRIGSRRIRKMAAQNRELLERYPADSRIGMHLCCGHKDLQSLIDPQDLSVMVELASELSAAIPDNCTLEYVHIPCTVTEHPATRDPRYYAPLRGLAFANPKTKFAAGIAHRNADIDDLRHIRDMVDGLTADRSGPTVMSHYCGMGEYKDHIMRNTVLPQLRTLCAA